MTWGNILRRLPAGNCRYIGRRVSSAEVATIDIWRSSPTVMHKTAISHRFSSTESKKTGLFTIEGLLEPSDFSRLADEAIRESDNLRSIIPSDEPPTSLMQAKHNLFLLDQISRVVCNVIDAAELCRSAHSSAQWRNAAQDAFFVLNDYIGTLNADQSLYNALVHVHQSEFFDELEEEERRFTILLKREFELDGIHLPDDEREHAKWLNGQVSQLETAFSSNITTSHKEFSVDSSLVEQVLPRHVLLANGAQYKEDSPGTVSISAGSPIANSILSYAPAGELRKDVHGATMTSTEDNLQVLDDLRRLRHEASVALGFSSYANRFLADKMAQRQENVMEFLEKVTKRIKPKYSQELTQLSWTKEKVEGTGDVKAWDIKFYTKAIKAQHEIDPSTLVDYLSVDNCISSIKFLVGELFGISMTESKLDDTERWDTGGDVSVPKSEEIRKFTFHETASGRPLGVIYLDLHPRHGKYTHAAHFTVRCGCRTSPPEQDEEMQLPVVALVCNVNRGSASFSTHAECETLFHEFGHAMHSLLSRTKFQHLSGTRAALDFVECPSTLMEQYVWDAEFLPLLARKKDGEALPREMIDMLHKSRDLFSHLEMQNQIALATFDQLIFSCPPSEESNTQKIWESVHNKLHIPMELGTHWYTNVGHLVGYGAGYYGYLYAETFARDIWAQLFSQNCLDRQAGFALWSNVLVHGGARDPNKMLADLLRSGERR